MMQKLQYQIEGDYEKKKKKEKVPNYVKGHVWRFLTSGLLCDI